MIRLVAYAVVGLVSSRLAAAQSVSPLIRNLASAAQADCQGKADAHMRDPSFAKVGPNMSAQIKNSVLSGCLSPSYNMIVTIEDKVSVGKASPQQVESCFRRVKSGQYTHGDNFLIGKVLGCLSPLIHARQ